MLYNIRNIKRIHGQTTILDVNKLDIEAGKVYALIGPNGAGKTTLLNILAFLDLPSKGDVTFQGEAIQYNPRILHKLRQKVVQVDQYPILFTGSVRKNVEYGLKIRRIERKKRQYMVEKALELVGMSRFINADAHTLSGGETKRVALARALVVEPAVLLCDEPTANVDVENQKIILEILKECNSEKRVSLLFATHSLSDATRLADHTIILENGRLAQNRRTNVFTVEQIEKADTRSIWKIGGCLEYPMGTAEQLPKEKSHVHLDPARISCSPLAEIRDDDRPLWQGVIRKIERQGEDIGLVVDCGIELQMVMSLEKYRNTLLHVEQQVGVSFQLTPEMFFNG